MAIAMRLFPALLAGATMLAAGCASAPSRFYTLEATAIADRANAASYGVIVGPVTIPASVDRPEFVVQSAPNQVSLEEFNRWASPLGDAIARTVAVDLSSLLGAPRVATAPLANFDPAYRVTIDVQRFDSIQGDAAILDAVWVVHSAAAKTSRSGRTMVRQPVSGQGFEALAAAHSRALAQLSADVALAIEASAAAAPPASR